MENRISQKFEQRSDIFIKTIIANASRKQKKKLMSFD
jgi:hypothetical protein